MSRDRSFTATKSKETRILAQENTGMRYVVDKSLIPIFLAHDFSRLVAMIKPKVGIKLLSIISCQCSLVPKSLFPLSLKCYWFD